jgi:mannitol/fructose-specific phosphotransferase system IIA component (Ntr-type)
MQVFSSLARKMDDEDFRQQLLKLETAKQVTEYLSSQLGLAPAGERESSGAGTH